MKMLTPIGVIITIICVLLGIQKLLAGELREAAIMISTAIGLTLIIHYKLKMDEKHKGTS